MIAEGTWEIVNAITFTIGLVAGLTINSVMTWIITRSRKRNLVLQRVTQCKRNS